MIDKAGLIEASAVDVCVNICMVPSNRAAGLELDAEASITVFVNGLTRAKLVPLGLAVVKSILPL